MVRTDHAASLDKALECKIASQLADTNRASLRRLAVKVAAGNVTLRGRVATFYEKQIALKTCRVPGIEVLTDAVEVAAYR